MEYQPSYSDSLRADILPSYSDSLMHYGVLGMKWGVRRYQNKDGSYTAQGKKHRNRGGISSRNLKTAASIAASAALIGGVAYLRHRSNNPDVMISEYGKVCTKEAESKLATYKDLYDSCDDAVRKGWGSGNEKMYRQNARVMRKEISDFEKIVSDSDEYIKDRLAKTGGNEQRLLTLKKTTIRLRRHIDAMNSFADDMEGLADVIRAHKMGDPRSLDELVDDMIEQHDEAAKQSKSSKPRTEQPKPFKPFGALPAKGETSPDESAQRRLEDLKYDRDEAIDYYNSYLNNVVENPTITRNRNDYDSRRRRMNTLENRRRYARQSVKEYEDYKNSLGHDDIYGNYLMHHGIKGQKWGVRRYQNRDGSYTKSGLLRRHLQAKQMQMRMNHVDRVYINDKQRLKDRTRKMRESVSKLSKKQDRSRWDNIVLDENKRWLKLTKNEPQRRKRQYDRQIRKMISEADKQGFDVYSKAGKRWVQKQKFNGVMNEVVDFTLPVLNYGRNRGTKYKVTPRKN